MKRLLAILGLLCCAFAAHSAPRCLPGAYANNFHTAQNAEGDLNAVLWCDDIKGVGYDVIGSPLQMSVPCIAALASFQWNLTWQTQVWNTCLSPMNPAQSAAAQTYANFWLPKTIAAGGPVVNAAGTAVSTIPPGTQCGLTRMPGQASYFAISTYGYALCAIYFAPLTGWPSASRTVITIGSLSAINDYDGNLYTITTGGQVAINGKADTSTSNVIELAYVNTFLWQENKNHTWYFKSSSTANWQPKAGTKVSPL